MVLASLKTNAELLDDPFKLPKVFQFKNYTDAIEAAGLGRLIINSLVISTSATFLNILFSSMVAFAIARHTFWGRNVLFLTISAGILVPLNALIIPYFAIINYLNLSMLETSRHSINHTANCVYLRDVLAIYL